MKVIKLTESDLTNIVKRVIKESATKDSLIDMIKYDGWDQTSELVGGHDNLKKLSGINTTTDFLNLFNDMNVVKSKEKPNWTLFYYDPKRTIISHNRINRKVYVNYRDIWSLLQNDFEIINESKVKELIVNWLRDVYNLNPFPLKRGMARYEYLTDDY
jgi:hypothetical protein